MAAEPELRTEQEVIARFQDLRQAVSSILNKLGELEAEASEHDLVIKALKPMESTRRCYRLIGDVLVERNVGEALPAVQRHRDNIKDVMTTLEGQLKIQQDKLQQFQQKYKIRVRGGQDEDAGGGPPQKGGKPSSASSSSSSSAQGVLVT